MSSKAFASFREQQLASSSSHLNKEHRHPQSSRRLDQESPSRHTQQHVQRGGTYSHANVEPAASSTISALDPHPHHYTHWTGSRLGETPSSRQAQNADSAYRHQLQVSHDLLRSKHAQLTLRLAETQAHLAHISERKARLAWHQFVQSPRDYLATHEWVGTSAAAAVAPNPESRVPSPLSHSVLRGQDKGDWAAMQRILRFLWEAEEEARDEIGRLARNAEHLASMMEVGESQLAILADEAHERKHENIPANLNKEEPSPRRLSQSSTFVNWPIPEEPTMTGALPVPDTQHEDQHMNAQTDVSVVESVVNVLRMLHPRDLAAVYHHLGLYEEEKRLMESLDTASVKNL